ncbi:MAG: CRISPR-associated endonuclease Cas3'' [Hyphomicrobiales bacterium]
MYFAHSGKNADRSDWQSLREHLLRVAELAGDMAAPLGLERAAYCAGLYHDLGKYSKEFQQRLRGARNRIDHSTAGAVAIGDAAKTPEDNPMAELIAYCIAGHHAGLPDRKNASAACLDRRLEADLAQLDPVWRSECPHTVRDLVPKPAKKSGGEDLAFSLSVMGRMIFSCLVDADFKDTAAFYAKLEERLVDRDWPCLQQRLPEFQAALDAELERKKDPPSAVNRLRRDILHHVLAKASHQPGLFTLTIPTGGGKTLTSLGFALEHARIHGHRRIVYAIPFTSIIDQTARIFRSILGEGVVLEHHSAIDEEAKTHGERQQKDKLKLAMEDWAAPVVVTTNVQFFESLFAAKPSRCRKLHNIAGGVIILDEAQTIPLPVLKPAICMLKELAKHYGCTIVLCTATQPALDERNLQGGLPLEGRELAPDPRQLARRMKRASIQHEGALANRDLCKAVAEERQALVIVNSRKHALEFYREAVEAGLEGLVHLTTRHHGADRRRIIARVRDRLKTGAPCRVIATSLIEAGVDVDFPRVWRAEAGLDQIVQAAGRCNREGKRNPQDSVVSVFTAPDYPPPPEIKSLMEGMERMLGKHEDLLSLEAIEDYFKEVYWHKGDLGLDGHKILKQFKIHRRHGATDFSYRTVGEIFRLIETGLAPVIIDADETSGQAIAELGVAEISSGKIARELQQYSVQIPPKDRNALIQNGHAGYDCPKLRGDQFVVLKTKDLYRDDVGLIWEDSDSLGVKIV